MIYKSGKRTGEENTKFIHSSLSPVTYSIDPFNTRIKVVILQQKQGCEPRQIKDLKLIISEDYTFIAPNNFFIRLGILDNYLGETTK